MSSLFKTFLALSTLVLAPAAFTSKTDPATQASDAPAPAVLPEGDSLLRVGRSGFLARALPWGPDRADIVGFGRDIDELTFLPDGRMLAITSDLDENTGRLHLFLERVSAGGVLQRLGEIALVENVLDEEALDLKADASGRLFLLTSVYAQWNPPESYNRLVELDPEDGSTLSTRNLSENVSAIAAAPELLWALSSDRVRTLDPDRGELGGPSFPLSPYGAVDMDVDSTGALWLWQEGVCSPPCPSFYRLDPSTGAITLGMGPTDKNVLMQDLVIERRCQESDTVRCLQGGRFRAELTWQDFEGQTGPGRAAEGRSADTALFYFFEKKNWELMVKVLNGCEQNGHFWVYGSASTTVEFTLNVTDLETGAVKTYMNPSGELATTITDSSAFVCN